MEIEERIILTLNKVRPFLKSGGGDIEFVKFENGTVYIKLIGACQHCPQAEETLKTIITTTLTNEIKEVIKVINLNNQDD